jgi:hypothetical protein
MPSADALHETVAGSGPDTRRATDLLRDSVMSHPGDEVSIRDVVADLGDRAYGLLLLMFALPNCIPAPPAVGSILGLPLLFFGVQMVRRQAPWLPRVIADRRIKRADLARILDVATPRLRWLERIVCPRVSWAVSPLAERIIGGHVVLLALSITLPVPLTNFVPAIGVAVMGLGVVERDGRAVLIGAFIGVCGLILSTTVLVTMILIPFFLLGQAGVVD